jgi:hypothetical protein
MFSIPLGMMYGAKIEVWRGIFWNLPIVLLGNIVGGSLLFACSLWYVSFREKNHTLLYDFYSKYLKHNFSESEKEVQEINNDENTILIPK